MSCNLDHALYNKLNISDDEKERSSFEFAKAYKNRISEFLEFISESHFSVVNDYKESWDFIKIGLHSLERYTNLGICFEKDIMLGQPEAQSNKGDLLLPQQNDKNQLMQSDDKTLK